MWSAPNARKRGKARENARWTRCGWFHVSVWLAGKVTRVFSTNQVQGSKTSFVSDSPDTRCKFTPLIVIAWFPFFVLASSIASPLCLKDKLCLMHFTFPLLIYNLGAEETSTLIYSTKQFLFSFLVWIEDEMRKVTRILNKSWPPCSLILTHWYPHVSQT